MLAAVVIIAAAVALAILLVSLAPQPQSRELPPPIPFALTGTVAAVPGPIPVFGSGTVRPVREVTLMPQVGGKISSVDPAFRSGKRVQAGQTLLQIEPQDYQYRIEVALADVAARRVALLEAQQQAAIAAAEYAGFTEWQTGAGPAAEPSPLTLRQPQLQAAEAALARDEARLAEARLALSRTVITAPFDGFVRSESVDVGQVVAAGAELGSLFAADTVEIPVALPEADAALIPGLWTASGDLDPPLVTTRVIAEYGAQRFAWSGHVDRVEAAVDSQTRTVTVVVQVPAPFSAGSPLDGAAAGGNPPLLVGSWVAVEIDGVTMQDAYRIPRAALQTGNEVWVVRDNGTLGIVPVRVWQRADDAVYVTGTLQAGQPVITGGLQYASDGMRVLTEPELDGVSN